MFGDPHAVSDQLYDQVDDIRAYIDEGDTVADEYRAALLDEHELSDAAEVNTALDGSFSNARPTNEWDRLDGLVDPFSEADEWRAHEESGAWASETLRGLPAIAVDGSELEPTDELNVHIGVTQVAWMVNHHQSPPVHELETETQVLAPDDVIVDAGSYSYVDEQQVQHHRYEQEIGTVVDLIERHANLDPPPVVFVDGSLSVSYANLFDDDIAERYQRAMSELLAASRHHEVPVVGYVAGSRASDVGDMIQRLNPSALDDGPIARDAAIFAPLLDSWGSRTALFVNRRDTSLDTLATAYEGVEYAFGDRLLFCYTNIGAGGGVGRSSAADKGYDKQALRKALRELGTRPLIKHRTFAPYDHAHNARIDKQRYSQRSMTETVNSTVKRSLGFAVRARSWFREFREIALMCVVYNIKRAVKQ